MTDTKTIPRRRGKSAQTPSAIRMFPMGSGLPKLRDMKAEVDEMRDVLMGREEPPIQRGVLTLMEVAEAYYSRCSEMTALIQRKEEEGVVTRSSSYYKFRTGELRTFMEAMKRTIDLGSRRITAARLEYDMETEAL